MTKILIVDDEPVIQVLLEETLEELLDQGVELLFASDGVEGWQLIQEEKPGLVLLDVMLPHISGYEICQRVRQDGDLAGTYIMMLTAKGQEVDRERGSEVGADEYVTKPFDPDYIVERAQAVLGVSL
jgi:two-component system alkaline phosphatase synthesis response regulator PhoP